LTTNSKSLDSMFDNEFSSSDSVTVKKVSYLTLLYILIILARSWSSLASFISIFLNNNGYKPLIVEKDFLTLIVKSTEFYLLSFL